MFNDYINALSPLYINHAYKYVGKKNAHSVRNGGLKISPFQDFRAYEDFRGDPDEGLITYYGDGEVPPLFAQSNPVFSTSSGGKISLYGCEIVVSHQPAFVLCLSTDLGNPGLTTPDSDCVFRISSLGTLARRVSERYSDRLGDFRVEPVKYEAKRHIISNRSYVGPDLFTKEPKYSKDREIRISWLAHNMDLYQSFVTDEGLLNDLIDPV